MRTAGASRERRDHPGQPTLVDRSRCSRKSHFHIRSLFSWGIFNPNFVHSFSASTLPVRLGSLGTVNVDGCTARTAKGIQIELIRMWFSDDAAWSTFLHSTSGLSYKFVGNAGRISFNDNIWCIERSIFTTCTPYRDHATWGKLFTVCRRYVTFLLTRCISHLTDRTLAFRCGIAIHKNLPDEFRPGVLLFSIIAFYDLRSSLTNVVIHRDLRSGVAFLFNPFLGVHYVGEIFMFVWYVGIPAAARARCAKPASILWTQCVIGSASLFVILLGGVAFLLQLDLWSISQ